MGRPIRIYHIDDEIDDEENSGMYPDRHVIPHTRKGLAKRIRMWRAEDFGHFNIAVKGRNYAYDDGTWVLFFPGGK